MRLESFLFAHIHHKPLSCYGKLVHRIPKLILIVKSSKTSPKYSTSCFRRQVEMFSQYATIWYILLRCIPLTPKVLSSPDNNRVTLSYTNLQSTCVIVLNPYNCIAKDNMKAIHHDQLFPFLDNIPQLILVN